MRFEPKYNQPDRILVDLTYEEARRIEDHLGSKMLIPVGSHTLEAFRKGLEDALSGHKSDR